MTRLYVVAYDTPSNRRRRRMAEVLQGYGQRVQDSVYECWLSRAQLQALTQRLRQRLHPEVDQVRIYPLCPKDSADIIHSGVGPSPSEPEVPII